jgi:hypothetical protein
VFLEQRHQSLLVGLIVVVADHDCSQQRSSEQRLRHEMRLTLENGAERIVVDIAVRCLSLGHTALLFVALLFAMRE